MKLRHYPTKRKLKKENECLKHLVKHLETELNNARTDLVLERTALNGYRRENLELRKRIGTLSKEQLFGFECVGVAEVKI